MDNINEIGRVDKIDKADEKWSPNLKYKIEKLNGILKEEFVKIGENTSESTKITYDNLMRKISFYEINFKNGKDIYNFSRDELLDMFAWFGSSSANTLNVYRSVISQYIDVAIERNYIRTNINHANSITYEDLIELVNKFRNNKIVQREYFYNLVEENIRNYQDQAILLLCFEGIKGIDCIELEQLKEDNFNFDNSTIKINREGKDLIINIPRRLSNVLDYAKRKKIYSKNNGNYLGIRGTGTYDLIEDSPYLIKPTTQKNPEGLLYLRGKNIQMRMIKCLKKYLELPYVTPTSLYLSGVIDRLKIYSKEMGGHLEHRDVEIFLERNYEKLNSFQTYLAYKNEITED